MNSLRQNSVGRVFYWLVAISMSLFASFTAEAYEITTHAAITREATARSQEHASHGSVLKLVLPLQLCVTGEISCVTAASDCARSGTVCPAWQ